MFESNLLKGSSSSMGVIGIEDGPMNPGREVARTPDQSARTGGDSVSGSRIMNTERTLKVR